MFRPPRTGRRLILELSEEAILLQHFASNPRAVYGHCKLLSAVCAAGLGVGDLGMGRRYDVTRLRAVDDRPQRSLCAVLLLDNRGTLAKPK